MKPIEIYLAIYRCTVVVFCGHNAEEIKKVLKKRVKLEPKWYRDMENLLEEDVEGAATTMGEKNRDVIVWIKKVPKNSTEYSTLFHELYHAVDLVMFGIDPNNLGYAKDGMSEPRAYLYQYLVHKCNQILWDPKLNPPEKKVALSKTKSKKSMKKEVKKVVVKKPAPKKK